MSADRDDVRVQDRAGVPQARVAELLRVVGQERLTGFDRQQALELLGAGFGTSGTSRPAGRVICCGGWFLRAVAWGVAGGSAGVLAVPVTAAAVAVWRSRLATLDRRPVDVALELGARHMLELGETFLSITGIACPYDRPTCVGLFREEIAPGCFDWSIREAGSVPLLLWHDAHAWPVGKSVTWEMGRWDGLEVTFQLDRTALAQEAGRLARDDMLTGLSIGFVPERSTWRMNPLFDGSSDPERLDTVRRVEGRLVEVSLTPIPAYPDARVTSVLAEPLESSGARSSLRDAQLWLRQVGHRGQRAG